jgi:WD40 repeat protein
MALHPTLDLLVTTGRDATARVWDMRTRSQVMSLNGHEHTVFNVKCQEADPQVITCSADSTIRLWDLTAGKSMSTLTHHKKGVRALALSPTDFTFASGSPDNIKQVFRGLLISSGNVREETLSRTLRDRILLSILLLSTPMVSCLAAEITGQCSFGITRRDITSRPQRHLRRAGVWIARRESIVARLIILV